MTESGDGSPSKIENALTPVIQAVLEKDQSPEKAAAEIVSEFQRTVITRHQGPLPDPETLAAYNQLITNGAERCMGLVERESAHRHGIEDRIVSANIGLMVKGQYIGGALAFLILVASVFLGLRGHDWLGGALGTTTLLGLIAVFVLRRAGRGKADDDDDDDDDEDEDEEGGEGEKAKADARPQASVNTAQDRARHISYKKRKRR